MSNGGFDAPWAKTRRLIAALDRWLASGTGDPATLLTTLRDETPPAPDAPADLPDAIPLFIRNAVYGTRCSTVVAVGRDGTGKIVERRFDAEGAVTGETAIGFRWEARG
ncbi:NRDE family protein [Novosphingobium colocasiae]